MNQGGVTSTKKVAQEKTILTIAWDYEMKNIRNYPKNKITLLEMQEFLQIEEYPELVKVVSQMVDEGMLKPIKNSGSNGKRPSLYNTYTIVKEKEEHSEWIEELKYLSTKLDNDYYLKHLKQYTKVREYVLLMNRYMETQSESLQWEESLNERSFEIFQREKFIAEEGGKTLLKNLNLTYEQLNIYETSEPLAYYSKDKSVPQKILFIENKDTFYSMRKYLIEGNCTIFGEEIGTLIYGGGKRILRSLKDFHISAEPYMLDEKNEYLYFGDLDYEGIGIYEALYEEMRSERIVRPFVEAYLRMIEKTKHLDLPKTKEKQKRTNQGIFEEFFNKEELEKIHKILEADRYIPQESLVCLDFQSS